jgi:hypothetical protein
MGNFNEIVPHQFINLLSSYYQKLDTHLKFPRSGSIKKYEDYEFILDDKRGVKLSRYIRNATALEKLQAVIDRLDSFFIGVEYFQNNIEMRRKSGMKLPEKFIQDFFIEVMLDSLRSSLDIFSMFVAWFYDMQDKETLGFSYKKLIEPLKKINSELSIKLNEIYKSEEYKFIKDIRDSNRHFGKGQNKINIENSLTRFELIMERTLPIDLLSIEHNVYLMLEKIKNLTEFTVNEFCKLNLGYEAKSDLIILFIDDKGHFKRL